MYRLELENISKQYPAVKANDRVSLRVKPGEIHAVLGENGAGKSTLMKIIYGAVRPDEGTVRFNGQPVQVASPAEARAMGDRSLALARTRYNSRLFAQELMALCEQALAPAAGGGPRR